MPINDKTATFTVNKLKPTVNPQWRGNLTQGTKLDKITLEAGENEVAGTYAWKNSEFELEAGLNRCSFVFTPEDTANYEVVTSYIDLPVVGADPADPANGEGLGENLVWVLVGVIVVVLLIAMVALIVSVKASKKRAAGDDDGFYDDIDLDD